MSGLPTFTYNCKVSPPSPPFFDIDIFLLKLLEATQKVVARNNEATPSPQHHLGILCCCCCCCTAAWCAPTLWSDRIFSCFCSLQIKDTYTDANSEEFSLSNVVGILAAAVELFRLQTQTHFLRGREGDSDRKRPHSLNSLRKEGDREKELGGGERECVCVREMKVVQVSLFKWVCRQSACAAYVHKCGCECGTHLHNWTPCAQSMTAAHLLLHSLCAHRGFLYGTALCARTLLRSRSSCVSVCVCVYEYLFEPLYCTIFYYRVEKETRY